MSSSPALTLIALLVATIVCVLSKAFRFRRIKALMPPGPPGLPVLGNVLQVPKEQAFRQFAEWANTYGPIISLNMIGQPIVVVNSLKVANELFDRRSAIYSDRPRLIMAGELLTGGNDMGLMPYGLKWRKQRRAVHEVMNIRDVSVYNRFQEQAAINLVLQLLNDPSDWQRHCNRALATSVTSTVYGNALANKDLDEILDRIFEVMHHMSGLIGKGRHMVEFLPAMLLLPDWLAKWKRDVVESYEKYTTIFEGYYEAARLNMHEADTELSFCYHLMKNEHRLGLNTQESAWLAAVLILAGVDTSSGAFSAFFLYMLRNPHIMHRAQAEVDAVVGRDRLPTLDDLGTLPYTHALVHELLRLWPIAPLSIPRSNMEDDWYDGYFIPKILQNLWAIGRNPEDFPDPDRFEPERFIHKDSNGSAQVKGSTQKPFAFGFGRRICPGVNLAMRNLFIEIACVLWAFDICPSLDEKGEPIIPPETECLDDGLVLRPQPFPCIIRPRSKDVEELTKATTQVES